MTENARSQEVADLTSWILHKHYCENDVEAIVALFEEPFSWFGAAEQEYAQGAGTVSGIFRQFAGQVPKCNLSEEEYTAFQLAPDVYFCTGRTWITTDPSTGVYLRVHQRVTTIFRYIQGQARCCHIHISNPYVEMAADDVGFPTRMAQQTREYLESQLSAQRRQIEEQAAELRRMSFEDALTGLHNRNKFNQDVASFQREPLSRLGVACLDLNGLKEINDQQGHLAGDRILRLAGLQIRRAFPDFSYRIGGDEFVVLKPEAEREAFQEELERLSQQLAQLQISCASGFSWREGRCHVIEQLTEADHRMYEAKEAYYRQSGALQRRHRRLR